MNLQRPELLEPLIHRFVVGTMSRRARRRFSQLVDDTPAVASQVLALEDQLAPMAWSLDPVAPSELVWRRIENRITDSVSRSTDQTNEPISAAASTGWKMAVGAFALAFVAMTTAWWQATTRAPDVIVETVMVEPAASIIADAQGNALWFVRLFADQQRASVTVQTAPEAKAANDYQLWILREDGVPVSLGLLPQSGEAALALTAQAVDGLKRGDTLAVSLEPLGGSPETVPTGPVLFTAPVIEG